MVVGFDFAQPERLWENSLDPQAPFRLSEVEAHAPRSIR
ncbi:hypothetical protein SUS17_809 [Sphingomonas sp. S17]|nr:hypothetical protein SUS17_809 [Sphingomonas sp. S17]